MSSFPFISLFSLTLILGSLMSLSGNHWIFIWMGLELNLLSFVPLLTFSNLNQESEAAMKYFLAQALGSGLILLGALSSSISDQLMVNPLLMKIFITSGLLIKLGMPPCHFWFPSVMSLISWPMCIILATWQKLIPILLIIYVLNSSMNPFFTLMISLGALIGGLGGMNQSQLRPLLAYSSIGHMSWILAASLSSYSSSFLYLIIYIIITIPLMSLLWSNSSFLSNSINNLSHSSKLFTLSLTLMILSLGGIPPLLGFLPKWIVLENLSMISPSLSLTILLGSALNLYYYLNLLFISSLKSSKPIISHYNPFSLSSSLPLTLISSLTLGLSPFLLLSI
uniref:NADH dehydrogenase subunit 2 n=1 Tax=Hyperhalosydna striata TaxID=1210421 RepID=UPI002008ED82|nr:NADH dehydrogenase subunit 2 [Hyperhalosydna striata]QTZ18390.1 NADH dehydrogenase subunit 2 [Hyperhalosydna striata]